jgi:multidrug resistance efflux pump
LSVEIAMNNGLTRILWFAAPLVLAVAGFLGGWLWNLVGPGRPADDHHLDGGGSLPGIVCNGVVDVEAGIASLAVLQPGRVEKVLVKENDEVAADKVLVKLEDALANQRVTEADAAVQMAQLQRDEARKSPQQHRLQLSRQEASLEAAGQQVAAAQTLLARTRKLRQSGQIGPEEAEAAEKQVHQLEALERVEASRLAELKLVDPDTALRRAESELTAAEARLGQAKQALAECSLKAPRAGKVLRILVSPGDLVSGQPGKPMVLFCPNESRLIRAEVEQEFAGRLIVDQRVKAEDDAGLGGTWHGRVLRIADWYTQRRTLTPDPGQFQDVRTVECLIELDADQPPLRIGQRMRVTIDR